MTNAATQQYLEIIRLTTCHIAVEMLFFWTRRQKKSALISFLLYVIQFEQINGGDLFAENYLDCRPILRPTIFRSSGF